MKQSAVRHVNPAKTSTSAKKCCPSCGSKGLSVFYEVYNVPIALNLMLVSRQEAQGIPRCDVVLAFCEQCGFITNVAYEPIELHYSAAYEDQQGFSPTFNTFARSLVNRLIEKYDLHDKDIIEVGCGKGDFLALICELGRNRGIGFDPAAVKGRIQSEAADRIKFINDYYSERYANYRADMLICRHTLEHIQNTAEFVNIIRRSIGDRLDTIVFFEVPDVARILRGLAFWDIYYEHCSYFYLGSLSQLFSSCGFEVIDLSRAYDDQYLLIEARPVKEQFSIVNELEEGLEQMAKDVEYFSSHITEISEKWRQLLRQVHTQGKRAVIWGSGS